MINKNTGVIFLSSNEKAIIEFEFPSLMYELGILLPENENGKDEKENTI